MHYGDCLKGIDNCCGYGKSGHKFQDFPNVKGQDNESGQVSCLDVDSMKKNHFYALYSKGEEEMSSML